MKDQQQGRKIIQVIAAVYYTVVRFIYGCRMNFLYHYLLVYILKVVIIKYIILSLNMSYWLLK